MGDVDIILEDLPSEQRVNVYVAIALWATVCPCSVCMNHRDGRAPGKSGCGMEFGWHMPLKVRTYNETVTPPLLGEADLSWHILEKSTKWSWVLLFQELRVLRRKSKMRWS